MRQSDNIRRMGGSGYKLSISIIVVLAAALLVVMLVLMPALEQDKKEQKSVTSIEYPAGEIGVGDDISKVYVNVTYSDGEVVEVPLSNLICTGLDINTVGEQNVSLTYGGFEQVVPFTVKSADCVLEYKASTGGKIEGEKYQSVTIGGNANRVIARPDVGYRFVSWSDGNPNLERRDTGVSYSCEYIANFEKAKYTVVFRYPDLTVAQEEIVTYNEAPAYVPQPSNQKMKVYGYVFDSWSLPFDHVTSDLTIDPVFVKYATDVNVTVTKDNSGVSLGSTDVPSAGYYPKDVESTIVATPLVSRSFVSWDIMDYYGVWHTVTTADIAKNNNVDNVRQVALGSAENIIAFTGARIGDTSQYTLTFTPNDLAEVIEIRANFVFDESTITFINSMNTKAGNIEKTVTLRNGFSIGAANLADPANMENYPGYDFLGWYPENSTEKVVAQDKFSQPTVLTARWRKKYCMVRFDDTINATQYTVYVLYQGALSAAVESKSYENPVAVPGIPLVTPWKEKYSFDGWYLVGDGEMLTDTVVDEDYKVTDTSERGTVVRAKFVPVTHRLELSVEGSGTVERTITSYPSGLIQREPAFVGTNVLEEISVYNYIFTAATGYCVESINDNGNYAEYGNSFAWAQTNFSYPDDDRYLVVKFAPKMLDITVSNGDGTQCQSVSFNETVDGVLMNRITNAKSFSFSMEYLTTKNLEITPVSNHYLYSLQIGGAAPITGFPISTRTHTVALTPQMVYDDTVITITYRLLSYTVSLPETGGLGSVQEVAATDTGYSPVEKKSQYDYGSTPAFLINADEANGYYIKAVLLNGKYIDFYSSGAYFIDELYVNNVLWAEGDDYDDRVTDLVLAIDKIDNNYSIQIEFAKLYYNVSVSAKGRGEVQSSKSTVLYDESVNINAATDTGYSVYGYVYNGDETVYVESLRSRALNIRNVRDDISVEFTFKINYHLVTVGGSDQVTVYDEEDNYFSVPHTFSVSDSSSMTYLLEVNEGYYISSLSVGGVDKVVPYEASVLSVNVDNVSENVMVLVQVMKKTYTVTLNANNSSLGQVAASGPAPVYGISAQAEVLAGGTAVFNVQPAEGCVLHSVDRGVYDQAAGTITVSDVGSDLGISVNFAQKTYSLTLNAGMNGTVTDNTVGAVKHGDTVSVSVSANEGHIVSSVTVNGVALPISGNYETYIFEKRITEDTTVTAVFETFDAGTSHSIVIVDSLGTTRTVTFGSNVKKCYLMEASGNSYIDHIEVLYGDGTTEDYFSYEDIVSAGLSNAVYDGNSELKSFVIELTANINRVTVVTDRTYCMFVMDNVGNGATSLLAGADEGSLAMQSSPYRVTVGSYVRLSFTPDEGYEVRNIIFNGTKVDVSGSYDFIATQAKNYVTVNYEKKLLAIDAEVSSGEGTVSCDSVSFIYGAAVSIRIIPAEGYAFSAVTVNNVALPSSAVTELARTNVYTVTAGSALSKADLKVRVDFTPVVLSVTLRSEGNGVINRDATVQVNYGNVLDLPLSANENNHISGIQIDDVWYDVDSTNLTAYTVNTVTQMYTEGTYSLKITKNRTIVAHFATNVFKVNLASGVNGTTKVNLYTESQDEKASLDITGVEYGRSIQINMEADVGYNISKLIINNAEITGFKNDNQNPNNNRKLSYIYSGSDGTGIATNLLIRVEYALNEYKLKYNLVNDSPNFSAFDVTDGSFGQISLDSYDAGEGRTYSGIEHGDDFRIGILPVREKGYVISQIKIVFTNPTTKYTETYVPGIVGGSSDVVPNTGADVFFSEIMRGKGISAMVCDIELFEVHFVKETFEYSVVQESAAYTGTVVTRVYHPNDSSKFCVLGGENNGIVISAGGRLEYGLSYTVTMAPSAGYSRTEFYYNVNGLPDNRLSAVRGDVYTSIILGAVDAHVKYVVNTHNLTFVFRMYNQYGNLIERMSSTLLEKQFIKLVVNKSEELYPDAGAMSLVIDGCAYDTVLDFTAFPNHDDTGYYISSMMIGTQSQRAAQGSVDPFTLFDYKMPDYDLTVSVDFMMVAYDIVVRTNGGDGRNSITNESNNKIIWGNGTTLRVETDSGYDLLSLLVTQNGETVDRKDDIRKNVLLSGTTRRDILELYNIKEDITVVANYRRKQYNIDVIINDKTLGDVRLDLVPSDFEKVYDVPQTFTVLEREEVQEVYHEITGEYVSETVTMRYDVATMQVSHFDELLFTFTPNTGYCVKNIIGLSFALYDIVNGEKVPRRAANNEPITYTYSLQSGSQVTVERNDEDRDILTVKLPSTFYVFANIEVTVLFDLSEYALVLNTNSAEEEGKRNTLTSLEVLRHGRQEPVVSGNTVDFDEKLTLKVTVDGGFSLDTITVNGGTVVDANAILALNNSRLFAKNGASKYDYIAANGDTYSYRRAGTAYTYTLTLTIDDALVFDQTRVTTSGTRQFIVEVNVKRNRYNVAASIYDEKSDTLVNGKVGTQLSLSVVDVILYGNALEIRPTLAEGYTIALIRINGNEQQVNDRNTTFRSSVNSFVGNLDVHDATANTIQVYYMTSILIYTSVIRGFVYDTQNGFSDAAGTTKVTYSTSPVTQSGVEKYEYFTTVSAEAKALSTGVAKYRFSHYEEKTGSTTWSVVISGERGVTLSGDGNNVLYYEIITSNGMPGNREFRAVYYRVLTVTVEIMPEYKYMDGNYAANNIRYVQYLTLRATVDGKDLTDLNPDNTEIYAEAKAASAIPYVKKYIFEVDSGKVLNLLGKDNVEDKNLTKNSNLNFYEKNGNNYTKLASNAVTIKQNKDFYLVARNDTLVSYSTETIKNESGIAGGTITWSITSETDTGTEVKTGNHLRSSLTNAQALDRIRITITPTTHYRFSGLFVKNADADASRANGRLTFYEAGSVREWTLISESTGNITKTNGLNGSVVFDILLLENMVIKFQFYRTFDVTYEVDYRDVGYGLSGNVQRIDSESSEYNSIVGLKENYDYNDYLTLLTPEDNEQYQFIGWFVNDENIYKLLDVEFLSEYKQTFRFFQNNEDENITNGLELRSTVGEDVYDIHIVAVYEPILNVVLVDELFFYDEDTGHWNSWLTNTKMTATYNEYYTGEQVLAGQSSTGSFSSAVNETTIMTNLTSNEQSATIADAIAATFPLNAMPKTYSELVNGEIVSNSFAAAYGNTAPWSELNKLRSTTNLSGLNDKMVYSTSAYFRMLLERQQDFYEGYNVWLDNILTLSSSPQLNVDMVEWQYYDWNTGTYQPIPYVSETITNDDGSTDYNNKASMDSYYINFSALSEMLEESEDGWNWSLPFVIRPKYQKKVTLTLNKKAYTEYYRDASTSGNRRQNPQIANSTGTNESGVFDYFTWQDILPYAGAGFRFIDWYFGDDIAAEKLMNDIGFEMVRKVLASAENNPYGLDYWQVRLCFPFEQDEQKTLTIEGRYIGLYTTTVNMTNIAGGITLEKDTPKAYLSSVTEMTPGAYDSYYYCEQALSPETVMTRQMACWTLTMTADAGLTLKVSLDRRDVGNDDGIPTLVDGANVMGYNRIFDKQLDLTTYSSGISSDRDILVNVTQADKTSDAREIVGEVKELRLRSMNTRTISMRYESFGQISFVNIMYYASVRLGKNLSSALIARNKSHFSGLSSNSTVWFSDAQNYSYMTGTSSGSIDGRIDINGIPIRKTSYTSSGISTEAYNMAPYGFNISASYDRFIQVNPTNLAVSSPAETGLNIRSAAFNSNEQSIRKKVTIDYSYYQMFGIASSGSEPGTTSNPYLIGANGNGASTASGNESLVYKQFRNIGEFYYWNTTCRYLEGSSPRNVVFKLIADFDPVQNQTLSANTEKNGWVPICYSSYTERQGKDICGFDGTLDGGGFSIINFVANGDSTGKEGALKTTSTAQETSTTTKYSYSKYGYGLFSCITSNAVVKNLHINNVSFDLSSFASARSGKGIGVLAARITGTNVLIENIIVDGTVRFKATGTNSGIVAGTVGGTLNIGDVKIKNVTISSTFTLLGVSGKTGAIAGVMQNGSLTSVNGSGTINMNDSSITGDQIGGLVGVLDKSEMFDTDCKLKINVTLSKTANTGLLVGVSQNGKLTNVKFTLSQETSATGMNSGYIGGLVGWNYGGTITNSVVITGSYKFTLCALYVGGLVGNNAGTITGCNLNNFKMRVRQVANNSYAGGIAGNNDGTSGYITDSGLKGSTSKSATSFNENNATIYVYPDGREGQNISGNDFAGKLEEGAPSSLATISVGGLVGYNECKVFNSYLMNAKIFAANVLPNSFRCLIGGIVGQNSTRYAVNSATNYEGIASCFVDNCALLSRNYMYADVGSVRDTDETDGSHPKTPDEAQITAKVSGASAIGGIVGGTGPGGADYGEASVRFCYTVNTAIDVESYAFGRAECYSDNKLLFIEKKIYYGAYSYTKLKVYLGGIVGATYVTGKAYRCLNPDCPLALSIPGGYTQDTEGTCDASKQYAVKDSSLTSCTSECEKHTVDIGGYQPVLDVNGNMIVDDLGNPSYVYVPNVVKECSVDYLGGEHWTVKNGCGTALTEVMIDGEKTEQNSVCAFCWSCPDTENWGVSYGSYLENSSCGKKGSPYFYEGGPGYAAYNGDGGWEDGGESSSGDGHCRRAILITSSWRSLSLTENGGEEQHPVYEGNSMAVPKHGNYNAWEYSYLIKVDESGRPLITNSTGYWVSNGSSWTSTIADAMANEGYSCSGVSDFIKKYTVAYGIQKNYAKG